MNSKWYYAFKISLGIVTIINILWFSYTGEIKDGLWAIILTVMFYANSDRDS